MINAVMISSVEMKPFLLPMRANIENSYSEVA
jgi:hypothetical protein